MKHDNDIDDLFQKSFESFEVPPPDELKKRIDEHLDFREKKRRFFGLPSVLPLAVWLFGGIALIGGVILTLLLLYSPGNKPHDQFLSQHELQQDKQSKTGNPGSPQEHTGKSSLKSQETDQEQINHTTTNQAYNPGFSETDEATSSKTKKSSDTIRKKQKRSKKSRKDLGSLPVNPDNSEAQANSADMQNERKPEKEKEPEKEEGNKEKPAAAEADSLATATQATLADKNDSSENDSSENDSLSDNYVKPDRENPEPIPLSPFLVGVQFGITKGLNRSDENILFGESNPMYVNFDASYRFAKIGVSSGINYFSTGESVSHSYTTQDSIISGTNYDYFTIDTFEVVQDTNGIDTVYFTITDSIPVNTYDVVTNNVTQNTAYRVSYFSLPIMLSYQQHLFNKLYLDVMAGGVISYQKLRFKESNPLNDNVTLSEFGFRLCVKTNLRYQFSKFGVSLNSNFNYDLKPVQYQQTTRKRQAIDFGVGLWYNF